MLKRGLQFTIAFVVASAMMAIPASASMGGLSSIVHQHGGVSASAKTRKCHKRYKGKCHKPKRGSEEQHKVVIDDSNCECATDGTYNPVNVEPIPIMEPVSTLPCEFAEYGCPPAKECVSMREMAQPPCPPETPEGSPCARKICVPVEEECPEKEEIAGPKG